jgi:SAM-dependent methyltransferase
VGSSAQRQRRRATFEQVAEVYDRRRPTYPPAVFDDLTALARLPEAARLVEIGCGTGQATLPLAERGFRVTGVELGPELAATARRKLAAFPAVEIVNASFETWDPSRAGFDAVVAFTAFHWIEPELRYEKSARLLRDGGTLAVVSTHHVLPEDGDAFFTEVQEDYDAVFPPDDRGPMPRPEAVRDIGDEIDASGHFRNVAVRRYPWDVIYPADEYIALIDTYSNHRALDERARRRLYERIRRRIEARPGGKVRKAYLATLNIARRL